MPGNLFMSYFSVGFTPSGGSALLIDEVTDVDWDLNGEDEEWYADGSSFPKLVLTKKNHRNVKVSGGNIHALLGVAINTPGSFTATLGHAVKGIGSGSGALVFVLNPCILKSFPNRGPSGKFATGDVSFSGYAPDGATDPLSYTVVA
jgi:hypothetical protein